MLVALPVINSRDVGLVMNMALNEGSLKVQSPVY
jgi:hypothetical protein